jgi:anti-sigma regulatory factor (Ser/Thr protein kinase)
MNPYKAQGKMILVDIMTFVEVGIVGMIAFLLVPVLGTDAAWMANTWGDILCLVIILVTLFILYQKISLGIPDILRLEDDFGANSEQFVEYEITDMADVSAASESVMDFCKKSGVDSRRSFLASLCVEELTRNIIQHGGYQKNHNNVDVRVVSKDTLTICVQDDCTKFDPCERMKMIETDQPEKNIGLRLVAKLADDMDYYNNAGINTLIIKL